MKSCELNTVPAQKRIKNFQEVSGGYPKKAAFLETQRCPQCDDPVCQKACPLGVDVRGFIKLLKEGQAAAALEKISEQNPFASLCGRLCHAPCEESCVLSEKDSAIGIRALERYAADYGRVKITKSGNGNRYAKKVGIIGSGPSGLTAAYELARKNYRVSIFESHELAGGALRYGIPEFRIPAKILDTEIEMIRSLGVEIHTNILIGRTLMLEDLLKKGFDALLFAVGAGSPEFLPLTGENLGGVYYANELLQRTSDMNSRQLKFFDEDFYLGSRVAVIGSNYAALDSARICRRLNREVSLVYPETEDDLDIYWREKEDAKQEGIRFETLTKVLEITGNESGLVSGIKCLRMDFADSKNDDGWEIKEVAGSEFVLPADTVIISIGNQTNPLMKKMSPYLKFNPDGTLWASEMTGMTSLSRIFACGDALSNSGKLVYAIASGKKAAHHIDTFLRG